VTGWAIGADQGAATDIPVGDPVLDAAVGAELYRVLGQVATCYYRSPDDFATVRRHAICFNGSFFTAQRMLSEYSTRAYRPSELAARRRQLTGGRRSG